MKISLRDKSISWKDFQNQFGKFFLISSEPKRKAAMEKEYERLTGRKAETPKKKNESFRPKGNNRKVEVSDSGSDAKANTEDIKQSSGSSD